MVPLEPRDERIQPLARELNQRIAAAAPEVFEMLSGTGRRLYFPKGILSQSAEARARAKRFNATIGIATEGDGPMYLPSIASQLVGIEPRDAVDYAPPAGRAGLRERWREKLLEENPSLRGKRFGLPVVTSAITHGLALVGDLFVEVGDRVLMPDKLWGNYRLAYEVRLGAQVETFPFFEGAGFNCGGLDHALASHAEGREKLVVLLNFPNNPTGYMPTPAEGEAIVAALERQARQGTRIVAVIDDAYFGLFYHLGATSLTESLFGMLVGRHPNLLAIKLDGATKELFAWGLRCGFLTIGPGRPDSAEALTEALEAKLKGAIRSGISNVPMLSQTLVERALGSKTVDGERREKNRVLSARAARVHEVVHAPRFRESWEVYPFNSGYFMCVRVKGVDAEQVRLHLLEKYEIGLISTGPTDLRVAFSCLELDEVEPLFEAVHKAIQELQGS
jgi:aspartate/methionine/tyrosine aminotransferase